MNCPNDTMTIAEKYACVKAQGVIEFWNLNQDIRDRFLTIFFSKNKDDAHEWLMAMFLERDREFKDRT